MCDSKRPEPNGDDECRDPVWVLLDQIQRPEPPAFFVQKVMGRISELPPRHSRRFWLFRPVAAPVWAGAVAALVLLYLGIQNSNPGGLTVASPTPGPLASLSTNDIELLADLDQLIAYEESATWLDTPAF